MQRSSYKHVAELGEEREVANCDGKAFLSLPKASP